MPYHLEGKCVYKDGDAKPLKCYDNRADALAYLRALEANVEDAKELKTTEQPTPKTVDEDGLFLRIWERVKEAINPPKPDGVFTVQKDLNGEYRWVAAFTNNFRDRDGEILSEKSLDGYLERVNMGLVPMPELWIGHVKESKHGEADMVFGAGNFVIAMGHYDDTELGQLALKYDLKHAAKTPLSHGFTFPNWGLKNGIYDVVNPFEVTKLPPPLMPSNPFTDFEVENMKQITPEQKAALSLVFGADKAEAIVKSREQQSEEIKAAGIAYKDFADVTGAEAAGEAAPAEEEKKPDPIAVLLQTLMQDMGELLQAQADQGKAFGAFRAQVDAKVKELTDVNAAQKSQIEKLQAELKLTPRAASTAPETKLSDAEAAAVKQEMAKVDADPFWNA